MLTIQHSCNLAKYVQPGGHLKYHCIGAGVVVEQGGHSADVVAVV